MDLSLITRRRTRCTSKQRTKAVRKHGRTLVLWSKWAARRKHPSERDTRRTWKRLRWATWTRCRFSRIKSINCRITTSAWSSKRSRMKKITRSSSVIKRKYWNLISKHPPFKRKISSSRPMFKWHMIRPRQDLLLTRIGLRHPDTEINRNTNTCMHADPPPPTYTHALESKEASSQRLFTFIFSLF